MKKIYVLLLLLIPFVGNSQTITQADLPTANVFWTVAADPNHTAAIPAGGAGATWDYSGLVNSGTDTSGFIDATTTPHTSVFPTSNLAAEDSGMFTYFTSNSTGFYVDGTTDGTTTYAYNPPLLYLPVPFSLNDTHNSSSTIQFNTTYMGVPVLIKLIFDQQFVADGSGTLTTPTATYQNVLRIKITNSNTDSVYAITPLGQTALSGATSQTTSFRYVTSGLTVNYLLGVEADSLGQFATSAEYLLAQVPVGITSLSNNNISKAYPNPANGTVSFTRIDENSDVVIYNSNGAEVMRSREKMLNVENLAPGLYHYNLKVDGVTNEGTFMIQR